MGQALAIWKHTFNFIHAAKRSCDCLNSGQQLRAAFVWWHQVEKLCVSEQGQLHQC